MSSIDQTSVNEIYKKVETLPNSIQKIINPKMDMDKIKKITILLVILY